MLVPIIPFLPVSSKRFCLSFSGTSLLQEIVYLVSQGADPDEIGLMNIDEQLPVLEYPQPGLDIIQVTQEGSASYYLDCTRQIFGFGHWTL